MIVCTGRPVDAATSQPVGEPHGEAAQHNNLEGLRVAGWRIGPPDAAGVRPAMCPRCAKPDPDLVKLCAGLTKPSSRTDPGDVPDMDTLPGL